MVVEQRLPTVVQETVIATPARAHTPAPAPAIDPVVQRYAASATGSTTVPAVEQPQPSQALKAELNVLDSEIAVLQQSLLAAASRLVKRP